jgi:hypothetical protein
LGAAREENWGTNTTPPLSNPPKSPHGNQSVHKLAIGRWDLEAKVCEKALTCACESDERSRLVACRLLQLLRRCGRWIDQFDWDRDGHSQVEDEDATRSTRLFSLYNSIKYCWARKMLGAHASMFTTTTKLALLVRAKLNCNPISCPPMFETLNRLMIIAS